MDHAAPRLSCLTMDPMRFARTQLRFGPESVPMPSVNELLELFMRQAHLERAMKQPGGARVIDARELEAVKKKLAAFPDDVKRAAAAGP